MVSRRKILSRSSDDLNFEAKQDLHDEEDVWHQKEKLFKDHIQEVLNKWESIDDEIWAKIIVLERNRRVAKAYARAPVLTVNGSDDGFDGFRIGLSGFENPMRDPKTEEAKRLIGQGCKIKMDDSGNILVKRIAKSPVFVKSTSLVPTQSGNGAEEPIYGYTSISNEVLKLPNGQLEAEKPFKLFDMKKFQQNVNREMKRGYPDRRRLECQCICAVAFVRNEPDLLDMPCWIMLINVVAMDMLKSKLPPVRQPRSALDIRNRPRIPVPDEDPYSIAGSGSSGGSTGNHRRHMDKPPKLPPRESLHGIYAGFPKPRNPDYEHMDELRFRQQLEARSKHDKKAEKRSDDPYYCGLRARIPNFAKSKAQREKEANALYARLPAIAGGYSTSAPPKWQHQRSYPGHHSESAYAYHNHPHYHQRGSRAGQFERNPTTWVPQLPLRNAVSEWESYWQKEA